ncbi:MULTISPECIES: hypothetical protein [Acetobacter]|uniref:Uncharacterized protein n=2 Tax=Acetobacter TaxID=434 RepID=A0AAN1PFZ7_9PROT|nr:MULTISPECIES: hypothetical protein [Acetobacter]ASL41244.1 hypothetical protein CBI36_13225 [Acetobacter oryzifermentans]AXM99434.1 hypothetical protein CJF59_01710 [Acetobacter pomorum]KAA8393105.1 hypothetical protein FKW19_14440 [Acetobacter sp. DmW_125128]KAA8393573.1 hypothetical protein FKW22_11715 [Acetobacter sp. DmW_125124]KAA8396776.1 hypothetical protein FKW20_10570 [Acetobacter sp. DmW_125127]
MENDKFCELARLIFGEYWVPQTAKELGFASPRNMQRIAAGTQKVRPNTALNLIELAKKRLNEIQIAIEKAEEEYGNH